MSTIFYDADKKSIQELINYFEKGQLDLNPSFQRESVWKDRDRAKLIDSILRNYPLPSIFLYRRTDKAGRTIYDVIDGKQRLESIFMFMGVIRGHRFSVKSQLGGQSEEEQYDWKCLRRKRLQSKLTDYKLQVVEVTGDAGDVMDLFIKINSTGKALTSAEVRKAQYYESDFLKKASRLARLYDPYFRSAKVLSQSQISRMKDIELVCELMVSAFAGDVINKKAALDKIMKAESLNGRQLIGAARLTVTGLNRLKKIFPNIHQTRFNKLSDFYSLAVLIQKFEREGLILTDGKRNGLARDILVAFSNGVDDVRIKSKSLKNIPPDQELYRQYLLTVREATDEITHRRERERILAGLLRPIFERKDSARFFSPEQRRILWNTTAVRKCGRCPRKLTWEDFTIDHIQPHSKSGRTRLDNAALMCRKHNSAKGNR